jgi:competence protein ComEC
MVDETIDTYQDTDRRALLLGMMIGDRSQFGDETYQSFIDSGLVHLIAVSGGNLVMIVVFLSAMLFRLPLDVRTILIIVSILLYASLVGMDSSVVRASIMAILTLVALLSGRMTNIRRLMAISSLVMLLYNPYFLRHDIGFIFSYAALIGIVMIGPASTSLQQWSKDQPIAKKYPALFLAHYLIPTLGASLAVMPFLLFFTNKFNLLSVLANIVVLPIVPLVMIGGMGSVLAHHRRDWTWPAAIIDQLIQYIVFISQKTATR